MCSLYGRTILKWVLKIRCEGVEWVELAQVLPSGGLM
jgi:hypothetical protein